MHASIPLFSFHGFTFTHPAWPLQFLSLFLIKGLLAVLFSPLLLFIYSFILLQCLAVGERVYWCQCVTHIAIWHACRSSAPQLSSCTTASLVSANKCLHTCMMTLPLPPACYGLCHSQPWITCRNAAKRVEKWLRGFLLFFHCN